MKKMREKTCSFWRF